MMFEQDLLPKGKPAGFSGILRIKISTNHCITPFLR